jgi:hypothetical protein
VTKHRRFAGLIIAGIFFLLLASMCTVIALNIVSGGVWVWFESLWGMLILIAVAAAVSLLLWFSIARSLRYLIILASLLAIATLLIYFLILSTSFGKY